MNRHHSPITRLVALLCIVLPLLFLSNVSAQDDPAEIDFTIASFSCTADPGQVSMAAGNIPDSCTPDVGASASVALQDGTAVGSCVMDSGGICKIQAPNEATVVVTLDTATLAGAVTPRENPVTTQVVTEFAGALFINLPSTPAPTAVPSQLPDTGAGQVQGLSHAWLYGTTLITLVTGAGALTIRRQQVKVTNR